MALEEIQRKAEIEGILFALGEPVELERLAAALCCETKVIQNDLVEMAEEYQKKERGIQLIEVNGSYQLCTKPSVYEALERITKVPKKYVLTDTLLETLSIIAYKQPVTKVEIDSIRGVRSDHAVNKLIEYNLVCEIGRKNTPGTPIVFGTTEEFLKSFGISSLEELPIVNPEKLEDFKLEAEREIKIHIEV